MLKAAVVAASLFWAVVSATAPAQADSVTDKYKPGTAFEADIQLPLFAMPLPKGKWKVAYAHETQNNNKNTLLELGLVQTDSETLTDLLIINTNVDAVNSGWVTNAACSRTDLAHIFVVANDVNQQDCYGVNHFVWKDDSDFKPKAGMNAQQYARNAGLTFPNTTLAKFYRLANRSAFVQMHHHVNTSVYNVKDLKTGWNDSRWHKDKIAEDPKRLIAVDQARDEAETWYLKAKMAGYF
jgi:hypothetical protein